MADVTIVCPTHGRAGEVTAFKTFGPSLLLCVAESQLPLYREAYPNGRFDVHPDSVKGLGPKVVWMHEKYGAWFRVDDDADYMLDHTAGGEKITDARKARHLVHRLADQAEQMGLFMFGFTELARPVYYSGHKPFKLTGVIEGGKCGFLPGSQLFWPTDIDMADDVWISGLNAYFHRACLIDMRYAIPTEIGQKGGLAAHRTTPRIDEWSQKLKDTFGEAMMINPPGSYSGPYPWNLRVPW
jgi:hypothetical protein